MYKERSYNRSIIIISEKSHVISYPNEAILFMVGQIYKSVLENGAHTIL